MRPSSSINRSQADKSRVRIVQFDFEREEPLRDARGLCVSCADGEIGEMIGRIVPGDPSREFSGYTHSEATEKKVRLQAGRDRERVCVCWCVWSFVELG
jgi:solute carrier family 27 (fatty acid transporter), member 1/4